MMDRSYGPNVLDDLAALVASTRGQTKPAWQHAGIKAALVAAGKRDSTITIAQLAHAALTVALDPQARTPQRIAHDGPWWNHPNVATNRTRRIAHDDCSACLRPRGHCDDDGHQYQPWTANLGVPMPEHVRARLAEVAAEAHAATTADRESQSAEPPPPATETIAKHTTLEDA